MGNTPACSSKPSPMKNNTSQLYKLKASSPLPARIHHYKEQTSIQPMFSQSKTKGKNVHSFLVESNFRK